ncbi:hypothetical protein GJ744_007558 [Endocarpon pusillum]|uniref:Extracellular membrane protein CFEM domain-containing protein n=1 Tax=Endocarpon pusillum TaxID=364733 RepID=A0A8H7AKL4_9EURO|nr:hypothetical protein GJ744_007558 [Endocarpon pusillum]
MFFAFYMMLITLATSPLVLCQNATRCHSDACLRSFNRNHHEAQRYCADHPNPWRMSPAPRWANECHSLGRNNNMRQRLVSVCSCLHKPKATGQPVYSAKASPSMNMSTTESTNQSTTQSTTVLAPSIETDASIAVYITSGASMSDEAVTTSTYIFEEPYNGRRG